MKKVATDLAYSMPNHTKYDDKKGPTDSQIMKAMKNENKYWFILVRKFENKYLPLLYFNLNQ